MAWISEGQRQLSRLLQDGAKQYAIAARCDVKPCTVSRWASGQRTPTRFRHLNVLAGYGIPHDAWERPAANDETIAA